MMTVIYLDVLIIINLYINYFLIKSTNIFIHMKISQVRIIFAAFVGSLFSLSIVLPEILFPFNFLYKLLAASVIMFLTYGFTSIKEFLKKTFIFFLINFIFAGLMLGIYMLAEPVGMVFKNGMVYFNISILLIAISTIISYFTIKLIRYLLDSKVNYDRKYKVIISNKNKNVIIDALADTGNTLTDIFSGMPVIICGAESLEDIIPENLSQIIKSGVKNYDFVNNDNVDVRGIRFLPFNTINSEGLIPSFKADKITIVSDDNKKIVNALIGISPEKVSEAIFNPKILL